MLCRYPKIAPVQTKAMDETVTNSNNNSPERKKIVNNDNNDDDDVNSVRKRFAGKVTPEQELSASVARRRRNIAKNRSTSAGRPREQTPVRQLNETEHIITSDEEPEHVINNKREPNVPERRKSKISFSSNSNDDETEPESSTPVKKKDVFSLLSKAKRTANSKEKSNKIKKSMKKSVVKRSQSAPRQSNETDADLIESFKKAQLKALQLDTPVEIEPSSSDVSTSSSEKKLQKPITIPLFTSNILRRRKLEEERAQKAAAESKKQKQINSQNLTFRNIFYKWQAFKMEHHHEYKKIKSMINRCLNDVGLLMIFCGLGGLMFKFTEGSFESFYKCGVKRVKRDFIDALWLGSHHLREDDWKSLARSKLRDFEEQLHNAHEAGMTSYSGQRSWSFLNAVVYAMTIVTTIGYGHMYPTTTTGRVLTIIYAIIGIPLFLIILTDFGKLFTRSIKFLWAFVRRVYYTGTCKQARKVTAVQEVMKGAQMMYEIATFRRPSQLNLDEENGISHAPPQFPSAEAESSQITTPKIRGDNDTEPPDTPALSTFEIDDEFNLPISVAIFLLIGYIFLGAVVYYMWERWDFFASFYFVFISMSTIGFGDYVPRHPISMIVTIIYLVFGLALMSMCINVVQVKLGDTFRQASSKLGATIGLTVAEEDGSITTVPPPAIEVPEIHGNSVST